MNCYTVYLAVLVGAAPTATLDFDTQVAPVLTKAGCNAGACHGAAAGRGGFHLSLYGSNPAADYQAIVQQRGGRRVNLSNPAASLLLLKPTGLLDHGGGYRLDPEQAAAKRLLHWIEQGAARGSPRQLVRFHVQPSSYLAIKTGEQVKIRAWATFADGQQVDVTGWTVFTPEDESAVQIDTVTARATLSRRGRHVVVARYLDRVLPLQFTVPLSDELVPSASARGESFIDQHVHAMLEQLRLPVSPPADDATFVRRLYLDLTGRLPTREQARSYLADKSSVKRGLLIDRLLKSPQATDYWTLYFSRLLRIRSQPKDSVGARKYHEWLHRRIQGETSYAEMVREMLTATGDSHQSGPANFFRAAADPRARAELVSDLFMGVRLRCANCHDHPLDRWTQDDYHGLAAIIAPLQVGRMVSFQAGAEVTHPRTGEAARPRIPGSRFLPTVQAGREAFADWLVAPENPYFARSMVNRLWKRLMGRGLVEPVNDMRSTNPATHPALLDALGTEFRQHGYSWRYMVRTIVSSEAYARSARAVPANQADDRFYSHALVRPLDPEVLLDALVDVTGVPQRYADLPLGTRAVTLFDSRIPSPQLDILGRCSREESCEEGTPTAVTGGLTRKLHLVNGALINGKICHEHGYLNQLLKSRLSREEIVTQLYRTCFSRDPTNLEEEHWQRQWKQSAVVAERQQWFEDLFWSLLACREFVTNH